MFCKNCGKELPAESQFCPYCMTKFSEENKIQPTQPKDKKPNKKLILIIGIVVAVIAIVLAVAVPKLSDTKGSGVAANGEVQDDSAEKGQKSEKPKSAENDDGIGLMNIKINKNDTNLTDTQKLLVQYFDKDYFYPPYNSLQRYPQIYKDAQISFLCYVEKIIESTDTDYTILVEYEAFKPYEGEKADTGDYAVIKGKHTEARIMEGDSIRVFGIYKGVNTYSVDGKSYTVPTVNTSRFTYVYYYDVAQPMYSMEEIRTIARHVFGDDVKVRYTKNSDFIEPTPGIDYEDDEGSLYTAELDNQSNANFTKYMFEAYFGGNIYDLKSEYPIEREITFSADFEHFYLQIFDKSLKVYTLECYNRKLEKIWSREFDQTTTAVLDYTADHIYLVANGYMYIINAATGEDAVEKKYVGAKSGIRKFEDGILLIAVNRSDAVMKTDLVGNVKWTANLSYDLPDPAYGADPPIVQVNGGNYVIQYYAHDYERDDFSGVGTYTAVISPEGEVISDSPAF